MANPISSVTSVAGPLNYIEYAKTVLSTKGKHPFVLKSQVVQAEIIEQNISKSLKLLASIKTRQQALELLKDKNFFIALYGNNKLSLGSLAKPASEKIGFGYLAEAILQCAIVARLVKRNQNVTTQDVVSYLNDFLSSKSIWNTGSTSKAVNKTLQYEADNKGFSGKDIVESYMSLNDRAFAFLKNNISSAATNSNLIPFINDATRYVNNGQPKEHSLYFYSNKKIDKLEVKSLGILGQAGEEKTKADIVTSYYEGYNPTTKSGKLTKFNLNLSVKIRGETQFGQASNIHLEAMERFASAVGVKLSKTAKDKINKLILTTMKGGKTLPQMSASEIKSKNLHTQVYKIVYNDIVDQLHIKPKTDDVIDGIMEFISYNDPSLVIVDIGAGEKTYFVKKLLSVKKQIKGHMVTAIAKETSGGNYNMSIFVNGALVLTLSSRPIQNTFRNYVDSGDDLRKWMADI